MSQTAVLHDLAPTPAKESRQGNDLIGARATAADDLDLQELHAAIPVPGHIGLRFSRKPSFFGGPEALGRFDALSVRDASSPHHPLVGMMTRSVRPTYVGGAVTRTAFINHLRVRPGGRSIGVLRRLCGELYELHDEDPTELTLATISSGNYTARGVLVDRPLKGFPKLWPLDDVLTFSIPARAPRSASALDGLIRERGGSLLSSAREKSFFPALGEWSEAELGARGLAREHMLHTIEGGEITFHAALWDQSAYKQVEVTHLSRALTFVRPFYNLGAALRGRSGIPRPGTPMRPLTLSFLGVRNNSAALFQQLLPRLACEAHRRGGDQLIVSFSARDPLAAVARRLATVCYHSTLYVVSFDHRATGRSIVHSLPYVDPGFL